MKADNVTIIGGADGPTSVFLLGREHGGKRSLRQKMQEYIYDRKKNKAERHIRADGHSLEEVADYIRNLPGLTELDEAERSYQMEYREIRASFIMQYAPQLLGSYAQYPRLESKDAEGLKKFQEEIGRRQEAAENVPREVFDIDLRIWEKKEADFTMRLVLESRCRYIGMSANGSKKKMKQFKKLEKAIWRYYGVTQEDIDQKTDRYKEVVRELVR